MTYHDTIKPIIIRNQIYEATKKLIQAAQLRTIFRQIIMTLFQKSYIIRMQSPTDEFADIAFNQLPSWIIRLLKVRNSIVKPFGLNTNRRITDMECERNQHEIIFGMSDKHLTFYVSLWCKVSEANSQTLRITTIVKYHNRLGKLYFFVVRPFHKVIIRSLLERVEKRYKLISLEREAS